MTDRPRTAPPALGRSLTLQGVGFAFGLGVHMLLSRWLGSESYGDLSATLSVALLVATLALFGFDRAATHLLARYGSEDAGPVATAFARYSLVSVGLGALAASVLLWGGTRLAEFALQMDQHPVRHAAALVVPMAMAILLGSLLSGLQRPLMAQFLGQTSGRLVLLALVGFVFAGFLPASEHVAVALVAMGWLVPAILLGVFLWRLWPAEWSPAAQADDEAPSWRKTARSYLVAMLPLVVLEESGILLVELLHADEAAVGVYAAAHRTAGLPLIALAAARQLAVPELAASLNDGARAFEDKLRPYLRFVFVLGAVIWLGFVAFGDSLLALFGHATEQGHLILVLIGLAYVIFLFAGLAPPVLQLHGEHRIVIGCMLTLLAASLVAGVAAVPLGGGEALSGAFAVVNLAVLGFMTLQVHRRTGVRYFSLMAPQRTKPS